ncbi:non-ribosomal peptide synthetase [Actinomadura fibrosa]|uniref:Amino acid adenylation domain-containing protein n=1 Tax=Actinomadura fibrosa TaxID=111802 RepID=A0ABW2Y386_9ACTN|nr:non-ribosomal peptide synthetase [Actinomadura fibrosa]
MPPTSVQQAFAEQCERAPDAIAVSCGDTWYTYRELDRRANRLAHRLLALGAEREEPVALLLERSAEVAVAFLAVLKSGGCYVPLHDSAPSERLARLMSQVGARLLLTDAAMRDAGLPDTGDVRIVDIAEDVPDIPDTDPRVPTLPDQTACVMFTSGSTGRPKGVCVAHRGLLSFARDPCWADGRHECVLAVAPHAFGVSNYEIWVPLLNGHHTVIAGPGPLDTARLGRLIEAAGATALHLVAGLFRVVAEEAPEILAPLREVLTGGDVITPGAVRRVLAACPGIVVRTLYGATETTAFATMASLTHPHAPEDSVPVGRPLDDVRGYILDGELRPVPPGGEGELYLGGARLARGYFGDPGGTAARFVADPFGGPGERMFRTGDIVRTGGDGLLEIRGRAGDLVKIRGFRVAPAEVEGVLAARPDVAQAVVLAREAGTREAGTGEAGRGERRLVAYVVPAAGGVDLTALRAEAARLLPGYAVPAAFVVLDSLPLTPNGKLDRRALPDVRPAPRGAVPRTPRQEILCALFAEVLDVAGVGVDDGFFELDGQSLQAVKLVGRIRAELGADLTVADLFNAPTVAELDRRITAAEASAPGPGGGRADAGPGLRARERGTP